MAEQFTSNRAIVVEPRRGVIGMSESRQAVEWPTSPAAALGLMFFREGTRITQSVTLSLRRNLYGLIEATQFGSRVSSGVFSEELRGCGLEEAPRRFLLLLSDQYQTLHSRSGGLGEHERKVLAELDALLSPGEAPDVQDANVLGAAPRTYLTQDDDPILAALWNNDDDAIYDNL